MNSKATDNSDDSKKKERAERARLHAERKEEIRRRLEMEIPVASPKDLSGLWHNSVEILSRSPDGQASTALWVLWETSLRLAALARKHGHASRQLGLDPRRDHRPSRGRCASLSAVLSGSRARRDL